MTKLTQVQDVIRGLPHIPRYKRTLTLTTLIFLAVFLAATQQVSLTDKAGLDATTASQPWQTMLQRTSLFQFQPVLQVRAAWLSFLINPFNAVIAAALSVLVGYNLAITHAAIRDPAACDVSPAQGVIAALPGLIGGSACCAPIILLILGVQVGSAALTVFSYLLPVAYALLIGNLVWSAQYVNIEALKE